MDRRVDGARTARRWGPWTWAGLVAAVVAHVVVVCGATVLVVLGSQGVCHEPAAPGELALARVRLLVVVAMSVGPWLPGIFLAVRRRRHRTALLVAASAVTIFPAANLLSALLASPADWTMDWCLF